MITKLVDYAHEQAEEIMRRFYGSQADWPDGLYNSIVSAIEKAPIVLPEPCPSAD